MEGFIKGIFGFAFFLVYLIAIILLKPFRIHKKRKVSTISLKVTYLAYLGVILIYAFIYLFINQDLQDTDKDFEDFKTILLNIFTLFAFVIPTVIIMFRRKIKRKRSEYNIIFSVVNCLFILYFLFLHLAIN